MQIKPFKRAPVLIAGAVLLLVCLVRWQQWDFFERLERMTFDRRAREALKFSPTVATNLGFVFIDEKSVRAVWDGSLGLHYGLYWPRSVYGRLVSELVMQGAKGIAFDIILGELRPDHATVEMADGRQVESDDFFAMQMLRASNVIIAVSAGKSPPSLFLTNAWAPGDITTEKDPDGILRRVRILSTYRDWHPAFLQAETDYGADLNSAKIEPHQIVLPRGVEEPAKVPLDAEGNFDLADFVGDKLPAGMARKARPFVERRVWHMGVVLAARELDLDLANAEVDLARGRIRLRGPAGVVREIPVDADGYAFVDWCMPYNHPQLTTEAIHDLLLQYKNRLEGVTNSITNRWSGKLAIVGSSAVIGNNLTDRGATPLERDTLLVSKHWNVANSVITGRFVQRSSLAMDLALIVFLGAVTALLTRGLRIPLALSLAGLAAVIYVVAGVVIYVQTRYWIPLVLPVLGAIAVTLFMVAWRVVVEQAEGRRIKSIFGTVVSEKILDELLKTENLSLGGERREITVMFADVRGFTEFTDRTQEEATEFVRKHNLSGQAAEACYDEQARETLATVNRYLGLVADTIIQHDATLDKFIGDCVMAFWGAPTANPRHALACVQAAIAAQRAIHALNLTRANENKSRELENMARISAGLAPKPMQPLLLLGSGINSGMATAGLMGSAAKTRNYTVFGREVNLASRLEGLSGRGRIFINETTYALLRRDDAALASTCVAQPPAKVKGISTPINVYEVPWRPPGAPPFDEEYYSAPSDSTTFTGLIQRPT